VRDLLQHLLEKTQEMRDPHLNENMQRDILEAKMDTCSLLLVLGRTIKECITEISSYSKWYLNIVFIETNWIEK